MAALIHVATPESAAAALVTYNPELGKALEALAVESEEDSPPGPSN